MYSKIADIYFRFILGHYEYVCYMDGMPLMEERSCFKFTCQIVLIQILPVRKVQHIAQKIYLSNILEKGCECFRKGTLQGDLTCALGCAWILYILILLFYVQPDLISFIHQDMFV